MSKSPIPPKKKVVKHLFTFPEALLQVMNGKKITRKDWNNPAEYVVLKDGFLCIHHSSDEELHHRLLVSEGDLFSEDWQIISEEDYDQTEN